MTKQAHRYPVTATCLTTGTQYHFPSINACAEEGFHPNMVKLCLSGQQDTYSGFRFTTTATRRGAAIASPRILETVEHAKKGLPNSAIAGMMGISIHTVKFNKQRAAKLGLLELKR